MATPYDGIVYLVNPENAKEFEKSNGNMVNITNVIFKSIAQLNNMSSKIGEVQLDVNSFNSVFNTYKQLELSIVDILTSTVNIDTEIATNFTTSLDNLSRITSSINNSINKIAQVDWLSTEIGIASFVNIIPPLSEMMSSMNALPEISESVTTALSYIENAMKSVLPIYKVAENISKIPIGNFFADNVNIGEMIYGFINGITEPFMKNEMYSMTMTTLNGTNVLDVVNEKLDDKTKTSTTETTNTYGQESRSVTVMEGVGIICDQISKIFDTLSKLSEFGFIKMLKTRVMISALSAMRFGESLYGFVEEIGSPFIADVKYNVMEDMKTITTSGDNKTETLTERKNKQGTLFEVLGTIFGNINSIFNTITALGSPLNLMRAKTAIEFASNMNIGGDLYKFVENIVKEFSNENYEKLKNNIENCQNAVNRTIGMFIGDRSMFKPKDIALAMVSLVMLMPTMALMIGFLKLLSKISQIKMDTANIKAIQSMSKVVESIIQAMSKFAVSALLIAVVFALIDFKSFIAGTLMFIVFIGIVGAITIAVSKLKMDTTKMHQLSQTITLLCASMAIFAVGAFVLSATFNNIEYKGFLVGTAMFIIFIGVMAIASFAISKLFKGGVKDLTEFVKTVMLLSGALIVFSLGVLAVSLIFKVVDMQYLLIGMAVFIGFVALILLIGMINTKLKDAAWGIMVMCASLLIFALGALAIALVFDYIIKSDKIISFLIGMGLFLVFVALVSLIGMMKSKIAQGGFAILIMVLAFGLYALMSLAVATIFQDIWDTKWDGFLAGVISFIILSGLLALASQLSPNMMKGAVAILIMVVAFGLYALVVKKLSEAMEDWGGLAKVAVTEALFIVLIGVAFLAGKQSSTMLKGAAAMIIVAASFWVFADAIEKIGSAFEKFGSIGTTAAALFIAVGVFAALLAIPVGIGAIMATGIGAGVLFAAVAYMAAVAGVFTIFSSALLDIAKAFEIFKGLGDTNEVTDRIKYIVTNLADTFGYIGTKFPGGSGFLGLGASPVADGISAIEGMGKPLSSIAKGLFAWQKLDGFQPGDLSNIKILTNTDKNSGDPYFIVEGPDGINKNIAMVVTSMASVFGAIGKHFPGGSGFLNMGQSTVADGIDAVKGMGKPLKEIAESLKAWQDLDGFTPEDFASIRIITGTGDAGRWLSIEGSPGVNYNIASVVTAVASVFGAVGTVFEGGSEGIFSDGSVVAQGISATRGVGKVLKEIADGLKVWKSLSDAGFDNLGTFKVKDGVNYEGEGILYNVGSVILAISSVFGEIGQKNETQIDPSLLSVIGLKSNLKTTNAVADGVAATANMGNIVKGIAEAIQIIAKDNTPESLERAKNAITAVLTMVSKIFSDMGWGKVYINGKEHKVNKEAIKNGIDAVKGAGDELLKIAKTMEVFKSNGKDTIDAKQIKQQMTDMIDFLISTTANLSNTKYRLPDGQMVNLQEKIKSGVAQLKVLNDASDAVGKIAKSMSSAKPADGAVKNVKSSMDQLISFFNSGSISKIDGGKISGYNASLSQMNTAMMSVQRVVDTTNRVKKLETFDKINSSVNDVIRTINNPKIAEKNQKGFKTFVHEIEKLAWVADPFEKFQKSFKEYENSFRMFVDDVNRLDVEKIEGFTEFNKIQLELLKQPQSQFDAVKDFMTNTIKTWFEELAVYNQQMQSSMSENNKQQNENLTQLSKTVDMTNKSVNTQSRDKNIQNVHVTNFEDLKVNGRLM